MFNLCLITLFMFPKLQYFSLLNTFDLVSNGLDHLLSIYNINVLNLYIYIYIYIYIHIYIYIFKFKATKVQNVCRLNEN